ncbi:MAG: EAL domain-containing protein [Deltaproteobacteria bacterium]|nr:EAL domain-containing protein [Deltaproteobacteria bacterium]
MDKMAEDRNMENLFKVIEKNCNIMVVTDETGHIRYANKAFEAVTGFVEGEVCGKRIDEFVIDGIAWEEGWVVPEGSASRRISLKRKAEKGFACMTSVYAADRAQDGAARCLWVMEDAASRKDSALDLALDSKDELTGLLNRKGFISIIESRLSGDGSGALLLADLDDFREINDIYGNSMGDEFLKRVARAIEAALKDDGAVIGRLGGDEFAVFIPSGGVDVGVGAASRIRTHIGRLAIEGRSSQYGASVGIALESDNGFSVRELLKCANAALYLAKERGENNYHVYSYADKGIEKIASRLRSRETLLDAMKEDRFEIYLQPIMNLEKNIVDHYEVLARMRDANGAILTPDLFVHDAEKFGLIRQFDMIMIEKAFELQTSEAKAGRSYVYSVNLSGKNIGDNDLLVFIMQKAREMGVDPSKIMFEITETAAVYDLDMAVKFIDSLNVFGFRFMLDDFGVGFTSFIHLKELNVDYIKIDGLFIKNLGKNHTDHFFVKAMTDVARGLGIKTVAEFVESEEVLDFVRYYGVNYAQGYLIGKPEPAAAMLRQGE